MMRRYNIYWSPHCREGQLTDNLARAMIFKLAPPVDRSCRFLGPVQARSTAQQSKIELSSDNPSIGQAIEGQRVDNITQATNTNVELMSWDWGLQM